MTDHEAAVLSIPILSPGRPAAAATPGAGGPARRPIGALTLAFRKRQDASTEQVKQLLLLSSALGGLVGEATAELLRQVSLMVGPAPLHYSSSGAVGWARRGEGEGGGSGSESDEEGEWEMEEGEAAAVLLPGPGLQAWAAGGCRGWGPRDDPDDGPGTSAGALRVPASPTSQPALGEAEAWEADPPGRAGGSAEKVPETLASGQGSGEASGEGEVEGDSISSEHAGAGLTELKQPSPGAQVSWRALRFRDPAQERQFQDWLAQGLQRTERASLLLLLLFVLLPAVTLPLVRLPPWRCVPVPALAMALILLLPWQR